MQRKTCSGSRDCHGYALRQNLHESAPEPDQKPLFKKLPFCFDYLKLLGVKYEKKEGEKIQKEKLISQSQNLYKQACGRR